jgi:hypothetical protein
MKRLDEERRSQAIAWLDEGFSQREVARKVGCSDRTVRRIVREYETSDAAAPVDKDNAEEGTARRGRHRDRRLEGKTRVWVARPDHRSIRRKACGAIVGVVSLIISVALTGTMQLAATDAERRDVGGSFSQALRFFPKTTPLVKFFNAIGPWSVVIDLCATSVCRRAIYVAQHRNQKQRREDEPPIGTVNTDRAPWPRRSIGGGDEIFAPDPGA